MFGMNFFDMGGAGAPRPFKNQYRCYSVSMLPEDRNESLEHGGEDSVQTAHMLGGFI